MAELIIKTMAYAGIFFVNIGKYLIDKSLDILARRVCK